jgi:hypothetical protein
MASTWLCSAVGLDELAAKANRLNPLCNIKVKGQGWGDSGRRSAFFLLEQYRKYCKVEVISRNEARKDSASRSLIAAAISVEVASTLSSGKPVQTGTSFDQKGMDLVAVPAAPTPTDTLRLAGRWRNRALSFRQFCASSARDFL